MVADYITFSWNSAFWIFNWVSNMVYPRYDLMIGDVREAQKEMETTFNNAQEGIEEMAAKLLAKDKNAAVDFPDKLYKYDRTEHFRYLETIGYILDCEVQ